jgi:hypothetical protein
MTMKQVKIYVEPELAKAFKSLCAKGGTSVTAELTGYMRKRTHLKEPTAATGNHTDRRWQRKVFVRRIISELEKLRNAKQSYRGSISENLGESPLAEAADEAITHLAEAIEALLNAYDM